MIWGWNKLGSEKGKTEVDLFYYELDTSIRHGHIQRGGLVSLANQLKQNLKV